MPLLDGTAAGKYQFQKGEFQVFFDKPDIQLEIVSDVAELGRYQGVLLYTLEESPNI